MGRHTFGLAAGWCEVALNFACWFSLARVYSLHSLWLWAGTMAFAFVLCVAGALIRSRWFFLPACLILLYTTGALLAMSAPETVKAVG